MMETPCGVANGHTMFKNQYALSRTGHEGELRGELKALPQLHFGGRRTNVLHPGLLSPFPGSVAVGTLPAFSARKQLLIKEYSMKIHYVLTLVFVSLIASIATAQTQARVGMRALGSTGLIGTITAVYGTSHVHMQGDRKIVGPGLWDRNAIALAVTCLSGTRVCAGQRAILADTRMVGTILEVFENGQVSFQGDKKAISGPALVHYSRLTGF